MKPGSELEAARHGNRKALGALFDRHADRLKRIAHAQRGVSLRARVHTSDLVQNTFVDALNSIESFDGSSENAFRKWLGRILENNIKDSLKYHGAEKRAHNRERVVSHLELLLLDAAPTPHSTLAAQDEFALVTKALEALPAHYRDVISERVRQAQDYRNRGRPHSSAERMLLARARAALTMELRKLEGSADAG